MSIKDFKIGQMVYILQMHTGSNQEPKIRKSTVKTIGRKYLTIENDNRYLQEERFCFGLVENVGGRERSLLFQSVEEANMHIEKCELERWLSRISSNHARKYTLEQLREVKNILS